tara:strand:+ start:146 stop:475 length:330 start_codon:yes stop_codon:yes gene_type:complete
MTIADIVGSRLWTINFYRDQLKKFEKVGLGGFTDNNVKVRKSLIEVTKKRLKDITTVYDNNISVHGHNSRRRRAERKLLNGQQNANGNGTAASPGVQDNGNTRYEREKS